MNLLADEPIGMIRRSDLLNILNALALTDCDRRTLGIVARATSLEPWFGPEQPAGQVVFTSPSSTQYTRSCTRCWVEQPKQLKGAGQ